MTYNLDDIRKDYRKLQAAITVATPFVSSLLRRLKIIVSEDVPTIAVGKNNVLVINPVFWSFLDNPSKAWVLGHARMSSFRETLHLAFRDANRIGKRNLLKWTLSADCVNNNIEKEFLRTPSTLQKFLNTPDTLHQAFNRYFRTKNITSEALRVISKEELYKLLPGDDEPCERGGGGSGPDGMMKKEEQDLQSNQDSKGEMLQEGYPFPQKDKEQEEVWKDAVVQAYTAQKNIGTVPLGLKRIIDELIKAKVNWRTLLRQAFKVGMGKMVVSSYRRPSRKNVLFPGNIRLTIPDVHFVIDASGSMSEAELTQALSEVYSCAKLCQVHVSSFDADAYEEVVARNRAEVLSKAAEAIKGGGGTVIAPALKQVSRKMRHGDIIVVFSDGDIFDLGKETDRLFSEIASKASNCVFATTHTEHNFDRWTTIKIEMEESD